MQVCHSCGGEFKGVGQHWAKSTCPYPEPTERQHEIITGVLMGDGYIYMNDGENPYLSVQMTNEEFLKWLYDELDPLSRYFKHEQTAKEKAEQNRRNGYSDDAREEDYNDVYGFSTRCLPALKKYAAWYETGQKRFPDDLELTPLVLKMWYVCDGTKYTQENTRPVIEIGCTNERDRVEYVKGLFSSLDVSPRFDDSVVRFRVDDSEKLWKYMGDSVPGFEYKWP